MRADMGDAAAGRWRSTPATRSPLASPLASTLSSPLPSTLSFRLSPLLLLLGLSAVAATAAAEDVLGCGGFVKSDIDINFSLIEIKLYTKQGNLKYQTDCAPNNGYFMIPLYDKGDFTLKIEPPLGWSFEPSSVELHVDGATDPCSTGEDIDFLFTGFSVAGRVLSRNMESGPAGVLVELTAGGDALQSVRTQPGGRYSFGRVHPGEYEVKASHATWTLHPASVAVTVGVANGNAGEGLVVAGYQVTGSVRSEDEPVQGVQLLLFSSVAQQDVAGCSFGPVKGFSAASTLPAFVCSTTSTHAGTFMFPSLPCGSYSLVPFYQGERITFDVAPARLDFTVEHDSLSLETVFRVMGFSVTGRVLEAVGGNGIPGAVVSLNNIQVITREDGSFRLENMTTGSYTIATSKEHYSFPPVSSKIAPSTPTLPDIVASSFSVCGTVSVDRLPEGGRGGGRRRVTLTPVGGAAATEVSETDALGAFCFLAPSGTYGLQVDVSEAESKAGLALQPALQTVTVTRAPVLGLSFTQLLLSLSGTVSCLAGCGELALTLQHAAPQGEKRSLSLSDSGPVADFSFDRLLLGRYKVSVGQEEWCWKNRSLEVELLESGGGGHVEFRQTGFMLRCSLSHSIALEFYQDEKGPENVGVYNLTKGMNRFCLSLPGMYKLTPRSCHRFQQDVYTYDTAHPSVLAMTATHHLVQGAIVTDKMAVDITLTVQSSLEETQVLGPLRLEGDEEEEAAAEAEEEGEAGEREQGPVAPLPPAQAPFTYPYSFWARAGEKVRVEAASRELLFYPASTEAVVQGESCPERLAAVSGEAGVFVAGRVEPALPGVAIDIRESGAADSLVTVLTDEHGSYRVGPLQGHRDYAVSAAKEGFVLRPVDGRHGHFQAFALASITLTITSEDGQPLPGVLLSLSGGQFRSNRLTQDNGSYKFTNLTPGQFFFKPMMKEFRFEPPSQVVDVQEGHAVHIDVSAFRVAYSCFGWVWSLSGEAEAGVGVEAVGQGACGTSVEESATDEEGRFRLRGLTPSCTYHVRVKREGNDHVERAIPHYRAVQVDTRDIHDVNIVAFRHMNQFDLSGNIITPSQELLATLKVVLYRGENLDTPFQTLSLTQSSFFHFPPLQRDGESYTMALESSLPRALYEFSLPEVSFSTAGFHKHVTLSFSPRRKAMEQEASQGSYLALPLTLLLLIAIYNHDKALPMLWQLGSRVQAVQAMGPPFGAAPAVEDAKKLLKKPKSRRT
ncbi:BOS complex subunit NOMO1-like [Lampetra fluviatilis]